MEVLERLQFMSTIKLSLKTTMIEALAAVYSENLFSRAKEVKETTSTIGVQTYEIKKLNTINKAEITIWDFAGQLEYSANHQVTSLTVTLKYLSIFCHPAM